MAIDTENKRRSAGCDFRLDLDPIPDGSIIDVDRVQLSWLYGGVTIPLFPPVITMNIDKNQVIQEIYDSSLNIFKTEVIGVSGGTAGAKMDSERCWTICFDPTEKKLRVVYVG